MCIRDRSRRPGSPPQEGDGLGTGAGSVGGEGGGGGTEGDLVLHRPGHRVIEEVALLNVGEGQGGGGNFLAFLHEGGLYGDLGAGHGEGVPVSYTHLV